MGQFFSWVARGSTAPDGSWFRMQIMGVPYPGLLNQDLRVRTGAFGSSQPPASLMYTQVWTATTIASLDLSFPICKMGIRTPGLYCEGSMH